MEVGSREDNEVKPKIKITPFMEKYNSLIKFSTDKQFKELNKRVENIRVKSAEG